MTTKILFVIHAYNTVGIFIRARVGVRGGEVAPQQELVEK